MQDHDKTREQLLVENEELRQRVAALEGSLQESQAAAVRLQAAPLGVHECDAEGRITFVNPAQERITGYTAEELVGTYIWDRVEPGTLKESLPVYLRQLVAEQPPPTPYVAQNFRKNGEVFDVRIDWNYLRSPQGQVTGFVSVVSDITEQRKSEVALRESEERFRTVFEEGPLGVALVGLDARIQHVNRRFCEMLGYTEEEIIALGLKGITHPDDYETDRELGRRLLGGELPFYNIEKRYIRKDGRIIWGQLTASMMHDAQGRPTTVIGMIEDITERKRIQEALQESEERYRLLSEAIPQPVWRANADGEVIECNRRWYEYTGQTPDEAKGFGGLKAMHPDDVAQVMERVREAVAGGQSYQAEYRLRRASDGRYRWHLARAIPMKDGSGRIIGWFGSVTDVDDRKQAEEALLQERNRAQQYMDVAAVIMVVLDSEGMIRLLNQKGHEILGYAEGMLIGRNWLDTCVPERIRSDVLAAFRRLLAGEIDPVEYFENPVVTRSGEERIIAWHNALLRDDCGQIVGTLSSGMDITEGKQAEKALQRARDELERRVEERTAELQRASEDLAIFRRFAEASGQGFGMADMDGCISYLNPALCRIAGVERPEDAIGKPLTRFYPEEYLRRRETEVLPALLQEGHWEGDVVVSLGGRTTTLLQHSFLIRDEDGNPSHLASVITDITERKQAHETLRRQHETLKHLLQSSDHERQLIAYDIHDGLAQHLAGAIMQFQTFGNLRDKKPDFAAKAYEAGMTMLQQGHFEARRLIAGVRPPILDELGVTAAVGHLVNEQVCLKGPKIEFRSRVDFDRLAPTLENGIYRIGQEGLANACQHSQSEKVRVSLLQRGDQVRVEIRDWGIGFDTEAAQENRFGLEGIRQRARLLGGKCRIRSSPGKGTRIVVDLPVVVRD